MRAMRAGPKFSTKPSLIRSVKVRFRGYALFQAGNNTSLMTGIEPDQRGTISGMLNLSRNLGLITGASVMGAVFVLASDTTDVTIASPDSVAVGMRITFPAATMLIVAGLAISVGSRALAARALS